ncbi:thioredoxin-like [Centruroides sculpturatus]|uniref:thioredoxin-like n=1 Tax=Centruroides sculpturatus TaxID=218467 RepID=UPI000C6D3182|nr:thioredoxin-like [Centruroides sculpturatus]
MAHKIYDYSDFNDNIGTAGDKLVVVTFIGSWCKPCIEMDHIIDVISKENKEIIFLKVYVDENEKLANDFDVSCYPTTVFIKNENRIDELLGSNEIALREMIRRYQAVRN